ncbi:trans-1,2-dihydrobenzene-1,2-diol dehydrogenase-like [Ptychodera flava]|uniref:trans-1,2-dihydrobenzene-1,2-diol dehydrogenase-like n=1 Tax=Ptychodera flava TaxID=63121 RepID=UPI00396A16E2
MASPTRWGIVSAGMISMDFCIALRTLDASEHRIVAVAARSLDKAKQFADKHSIDKAYGSYEELSKDDDVDIAYIGAIHTEHAKLSKMMLNAGKNVLCEKPMGLTVKETKEILELAKEKNLFFMEGLWSRHFPIYEKIRSIVSSGRIGNVEMITADFGFAVLSTVPRFVKKELAGGAIFDIGIYPIQLAVMIFGREMPKITIRGNLAETGVDEASTSILQYSNNRMAVLNLHGRVDLNNEANIYGTKGRLRVSLPFWAPTKMTVEDSNGVEVVEEPLPKTVMATNFINSAGLRYEAITARRCLLEGKRESELVSHEDSMTFAAIMETMRHNLGYTLPGEQEKIVMPCQ